MACGVGKSWKCATSDAGLLDRARRLLPGLWAGWLLCVALLATPAVFAQLSGAEAGRMVGRMLAQEAYTSLVLGVMVLLLERLAARRSAQAGAGPQITVGVMLALGTLFCTVAGYFAIQPMMPAARAGQGAFSFGQLHAASAAFYVIKALLVLALAWRAARAPAPVGKPTAPAPSS